MRTRHHNQKLVFLERQRKLFAGALACALLAGCGAYNDQSYDGAEYLRRWKVTDSSGKTLSAGCAKESDASLDDSGTENPEYWATRIEVPAATGSVITYEDNLGRQYVEKSRTKQELPTSDAYWCSNQDTVHVEQFGYRQLDAVEVTDSDPPATIIKVDLVNPHNNPQLGVVAEGYVLHLKVQHPGVLHLGFPGPANPDAGTDAGADAGTKLYGVYAAMTIQ